MPSTIPDDPGIESQRPDPPQPQGEPGNVRPPEFAQAAEEPWETRILLKILMGPQGLRAGWSVALAFALFFLISGLAGTVFLSLGLIDLREHFDAGSEALEKLTELIGVAGAAAVVALIERRRGNLLAYNLIGPRPALRFFEGLLAGFVALSLLIGGLAWGGWLHFGPVALSGVQILRFAALWGVAFLVVGCVEEGSFRCFLQFTLTRSINFWWALGIEAAVCLKLYFFNSGNGNWGVYVLAGLGLVPCLLLHLNKVEGANFWYAGWVTTTLFGLLHTGNNGENWVGIFAAGSIGFAFVVSIRVTGSAWWAIGCHAAWDWAETYFYGTADSGNVATGHYLTTSPAGPAFWSGGTDGPEGSILVIAVIVLMILALVAIYGRRRTAEAGAPAAALAVE